jgi:hypothetical protein
VGAHMHGVALVKAGNVKFFVPRTDHNLFPVFPTISLHAGALSSSITNPFLHRNLFLPSSAQLHCDDCYVMYNSTCAVVLRPQCSCFVGGPLQCRQGHTDAKPSV